MHMYTIGELNYLTKVEITRPSHLALACFGILVSNVTKKRHGYFQDFLEFLFLEDAG